MKRLSAEARAELERRRVEIGSFGSVVDARAACERDAEVRCRQSDRQKRACGASGAKSCVRGP